MMMINTVILINLSYLFKIVHMQGKHPEICVLTWGHVVSIF
jgi:hypothetical protein